MLNAHKPNVPRARRESNNAFVWFESAHISSANCKLSLSKFHERIGATCHGADALTIPAAGPGAFLRGRNVKPRYTTLVAVSTTYSPTLGE
jgi:hypothetical protein